MSFKAYTPKEKECVECGSLFLATGTRSIRCNNCSKQRLKVQVRKNTYKHAVKTGKIKNPGVGSGNAQGFGEEHHSWKYGAVTYRNFLKEACERCGRTFALIVHHKDGNRKNGEVSNLETLCRKCHQKHHYEERKLGENFRG